MDGAALCGFLRAFVGLGLSRINGNQAGVCTGRRKFPSRKCPARMLGLGLLVSGG